MKRQPFFNKEGQGSFFSKSNETSQSFFSPITIQPKLTIGQPNDKYEVEADAMADKVVQRLNSPFEGGKGDVSQTNNSAGIQRKCSHCEEEENLQKKEDDFAHNNIDIQRKPIFESNAEQPEADVQTKPISAPIIQAKCSSCEEEEKLQKKEEEELADSELSLQRKSDDTTSENTSGLESRLNSSKGGGSSLPSDIQSSMGSEFGANFSNVRVHTGTSAVQMSQDIGAQAFTYGSDIYFNQGKYDTNSNSGKHLLAHELTHTLQQGRGSIQKEELENNSSQIEPKAIQSKQLGYDSVYWLEDKKEKNGKFYKYVELRTSASLYDLASYLYGDPFKAEVLSSENGIVEDSLNNRGKRVRVTGGKLLSLRTTGKANTDFRNSPWFPSESSPAFILSTIGITNPKDFLPTEKKLDEKLNKDFEIIVSEIDRIPRSFYGIVDQKILAFLDKWAKEKFIKNGYLWQYKNFLNGGVYLEILLGKLYQKNKTFKGVFVDDYTDYYSIMIKEFPNSNKVKLLINKYPTRYSDYKQLVSSGPPSFFDEVIITTVKGVPGGITAATGGFMESLPFGIGEDAGGWLKQQSKTYLKAVNYGDEEMINQAVDGSSLVGGVFGEAVQMLYGGTAIKVISAIESVNGMADFNHLIDKIDELKMFKESIPTLLDNKEKLLDIALGFEKNEAIEKLEAWVLSPTNEPKIKVGKKDAKGKKGLVNLIKKITAILKKVKKALKYVFDIRKKFLELIDKFGLALIGIPAFIKLIKLMSDPKGNAAKIKRIAQKFTKEIITKVQEILGEVKTLILSNISQFEELLTNLSISAKEIADVVTAFTLEVVSKKVQVVKLLKNLTPVRELISEHLIQKLIPSELLNKVNETLKSFAVFIKPLFIGMRDGIGTIHEEIASVLNEKIIPQLTSIFIQPKRESGSAKEPYSASSVVNNMKESVSKKLPNTVRHKMEGNFQQNFENVDIHDGVKAQNANHELQSKAFTHGNQIYFNKNEYNPSSPTGTKLLAHELTHVVQQSKSSNKFLIQRSLDNLPEKITGKIIDQIEDRIRSLKKFRNEKKRAKALTKLSKYLQKNLNTNFSKEDIERLKTKFGFTSLDIVDKGENWEINYEYEDSGTQKVIQHKRFAKKPTGNRKKDWEDIENGVLLDLTGYDNEIGKQMNLNPKFIPKGDKKKRSNKERGKKGLSPYLNDNVKVELHHKDQNFFSVLDEVSNVHHRKDYRDLHAMADDAGYISWRGWIALYKHQIRTLGDIYNLIRQRYWRKRFKTTGNAKGTPTIQPKLNIGQPNDKYEVEADIMADRVVRKLNSPQISIVNTNGIGNLTQSKYDENKQEEKIQTKEEGANSNRTSSLESQLMSSKGSGVSLSAEVQNSMGSEFGTDFSNVKVHTGSEAVQMNRELNAQAFTHDNNIYFNEGKYKPKSANGKHLLAHELTHTVQQNKAIAQKSSIQKVLNDEEVIEFASQIHGSIEEGRDYLSETEMHLGTRILREQQSNLNQIKIKFKAIYRVPLQYYIRDHYFGDYMVKATALLHEPNYLSPTTQLALCLIPIKTRDAEFWSIMEGHSLPQRQRIQINYNRQFNEIGEGTLWKDIQGDLAGQDEIKAHIMLHRELTPADNLYLITAGQVGTDVDTVFQILRTQWSQGAVSFERFANSWDPTGQLPDAINGLSPLVVYFYPSGLMRFSNANAIQNNLTTNARSMMYSVLDELSGGARSVVLAIFQEFLALKDPDRTEITETGTGVEFTAGEQADLNIAIAALATSEAFTTDEEEFYRAIRHIGRVYRHRTNRLSESGADTSVIMLAMDEWIAEEARLESEHIQPEMDTDYEIMRARLEMGGIEDEDRIYLNRNDYSQMMSIVERIFRKGKIDYIMEEASRNRVNSSGQIIRPAYHLLDLVPITSGDDFLRFHQLIRQDRNNADRGGYRIRWELEQGVNDDVMEHLNDFLVHDDWHGNLKNEVLDSYCRHFLRSSSTALNPGVRLIMRLYSRGFEGKRGFSLLRDELNPAMTAHERMVRAQEDRALENSGFGSISNLVVGAFDTITGEDSLQIVDESLRRLRVFANQSGANEDEMNAFREIYGGSTDLSEMEYEQFQTKLGRLREAKATVSEFAGSVLSLTLQAALTALTAGTAGTVFIANAIARQIAISAVSEMAGMVTREVLDSRGYDLISVDNLQSLIVSAADAGAGAFVESGTRLSGVIEEFAQSEYARAALRQGFSSVVSGGTNNMINGMRGRLTAEQLITSVTQILTGAASAGISSEQIRERLIGRFPRLEGINEDYLEDILQNVSSGLLAETVDIASSATDVRGINGSEVAGRLATSVATGLRDATLAHVGRTLGTYASEAIAERRRLGREGAAGEDLSEAIPRPDRDAYEEERDVDMLAHAESPDGEHEIEIYPDGIGRCSAVRGRACPLLRFVFGEVLSEMPITRRKLIELEMRIGQLDESHAQREAETISELEQRLRDLQERERGGVDMEEIDRRFGEEIWGVGLGINEVGGLTGEVETDGDQNNRLHNTFSLEELQDIRTGSRRENTRLEKFLDNTDPINYDDAVPRPQHEFQEWFDALTPSEFETLWSNPDVNRIIAGRVRAPGGFHEWLKVSQLPKLKEWGISMRDIHELRTRTGQTFGRSFVHGGVGSTDMHLALDRMFDVSDNYDEFREELNSWADNELIRGRYSLPRGLQIILNN